MFFPPLPAVNLNPSLRLRIRSCNVHQNQSGEEMSCTRHAEYKRLTKGCYNTVLTISSELPRMLLAATLIKENETRKI